MRKVPYWVTVNPRIIKENQKIINEFLLSIKSENKTPQTVNAYRKALERFFVDFYKRANKVTTDDVQFLIRKLSKGRSNSTKIFYMNVLRSFLNYCRSEGYLEGSYIKKRWYPRKNKHVLRTISKCEQEKLRIAAEQLSITHRLIVEFLLSTGCRNGELCSLNIGDIDLETCSAKIHGKGNKWRIVYFSETVKIILEQVLMYRKNKDSPLLTTITGDRAYIGWIDLRFKECVDKAGLRHEISPHFCRHAFAANLLAQGKEESIIKDALGHTSFQTTTIYLDVLPEKIKQAFDKYMIS